MVSYPTKYTKIDIDTDCADTESEYHGYIAISFNYNEEDASAFFMDSYQHEILDDVKIHFAGVNDKYPEEINIEDTAILVTLHRPEDCKHAPDLVSIVRKYERQFLDKIKEI